MKFAFLFIFAKGRKSDENIMYYTHHVAASG